MNTDTPELAAIISASIAAKMTPDFIREKIDARAEKLIDDAITDAMRSYGNIGKLVAKSVEDSLKVDRLDLPSYGHIVTSMLQAQIEALVHPLVAGQLAEDMEGLLKLAPKAIKLSDIVKTLVDDKDEYGDVCTCVIERTDYGSVLIGLDETVVSETSSYLSQSKTIYKCEVQIHLSDKGTILSATFNGADMKTMRQVGHGRYGLEQRIRAYHACGTIIEVDEDNVSTCRDID